jgi:hypothetical protein
MAFELTYDNQKHALAFPFDGSMAITSSPFTLEYTLLFDGFRRISPFEEHKVRETKKLKSASEMDLSSIDGYMVADYTIGFDDGHGKKCFKLEVLKGIVYLNEKPLEDYLSDPKWNIA